MKTKLLLTVLFSIGIIGITNAQSFAKNDRGPARMEMVKTQHSVIQHQKEVRKPAFSHKRHNKRKAHRVIKRHHHVVRHQGPRHF